MKNFREQLAKDLYDSDNADSEVGSKDPTWEQTYPYLRTLYLKRADVAIAKCSEYFAVATDREYA